MDIRKEILNAKTVEDVNILKENINKLCEARIEKLNFLNTVSDISSFHEIKTIFEAMAPSLFSTHDGRVCIKSFLTTINENKSLQTAYLLNENIAHCAYEGDKKSFLMESLGMIKDVSKAQFLKGIAKLQENLMEGISILTDEDIANINKAINEININKPMGEVLDSVTFNPKRMSSLLEFNHYVDALVPFMEQIQKNSIKLSENNNVETVEEILNRINEEESKENLEFFKTLVESENKETIFEEYKDNCTRAIRKAIRENKSNTEVSNKLENILEKVNRKTYNISTFGSDIASFIELENVVNE
jgi:hypothetical protein